MITTIPLPHSSNKWTVNQFYIPRELQAIVSFVAKLTIGHVSPFKQSEVAVNIHAVSSRHIRFLNRRYRGKDKPTNVLAFPADALPYEIDGLCREMGDIFLCLQVIRTEVEESGFHSYLARMVVHGMLHLMGYDHENDQDEQRMLQKERLILAKLDIVLE